MPDAPPLAEPAPLAVPAGAPMPSASGTCAACGERLVGPYCYGCGEGAPGTRQESVVRVLVESFQEVTSADGKLWQSLRVLFRPGHLTAAYFDGRAGRTLRPFRLFLVVNVALFFLLGFLDENPLIGELEMQRQSLGFGVAAAADARLAAWGGDSALFELAFNTRSRTLASTLIVLLIPMIAGTFSLAFGMGRGARHLVFATHVLTALIAFYVGLSGVLMALILLEVVPPISGAAANWTFLAAVVSLTAAFVALGARRVYGAPRWRAWLGGAVVSSIGLAAAVMVYRVLLFWLTLWTLRLPSV